MPRATSKLIGLDFHDVEKMKKRFEKMDANIKPIVEKALKASHKHVTNKLEEHMSPQYLPAKGKYARGNEQTKKSIVKDDKVFWIGGTEAYIGVGFDVSKELTSIFLMYGTPKMKPNKELYNDIFSKKTRTEIREIQQNIFFDELNKIKGD